MAEVINMPVDSLDRRGRDRKEKPSGEDPQSSPPPPPPPPRRRDRDSRERREDRDFDRPPNRRGGDYYDRNRSPPPPRERERDYKRRSSMSPPPVPYRDRRHSPPPRRSPPYKRSRREDGGYEGRRGSPRGGFGPGDRRFGYDYAGGYEREIGGRPSYGEERLHGRYMGHAGGYQSGPSDWDSGRGNYGDASNTIGTQRLVDGLYHSVNLDLYFPVSVKSCCNASSCQIMSLIGSRSKDSLFFFVSLLILAVKLCLEAFFSA
uniref:Serrate RNA effector molecule n=1 Tax=Rhizophora mucronata TaxID=61149 RepID=A0A2P2ML12_RHIMU